MKDSSPQSNRCVHNRDYLYSIVFIFDCIYILPMKTPKRFSCRSVGANQTRTGTRTRRKRGTGATHIKSVRSD